jgi:signal transduction histidine kinase
MNRLVSQLTIMSRGRLLALCVALVLAIGMIDYLTGYEMSVTILYLAPIFIAAWTLGSVAALGIACLATAAWSLSIYYILPAYAKPMLHVWGGVIQFGMFILFGGVVSKLKSALSHADERFATVLEGLNSAVYVSDAKTGEVLYANEQFRRTFPAGTRLPNLPQSAREGEVHDTTRGKWYLIHSRPVRWIDGRTVRLQLATDITERRRAEALYRQQQEKMQLTARLVTVGEMASTIAHELNQPLAAITNYNMGCVRRLNSGHWNEAELLDVMQKSAAQAERASKVVQRVRAFVARRAPNLVLCDINEVVSGVSQMIGVEARQSGATLKLELSSFVPYVRADPLLMEQVILNLSRNAIEAMQEARNDERQVTIRSRPNGSDLVEVEVADCGRGIDPQLEANLFTPFFSTKREGMGLGLHICRSIVEAHGGRVWVSRNSDEGVTFHFSLKSVFAT